MNRTVITLTGFLGAGKTTTTVALAEMMEAAGRRVAIITNDQSTGLIDTAVAQANDRATAEVTGGCFCCRFEDLEHAIDDVVRQTNPEVIVAEAVGSCTDIKATVVRPLRGKGQFTVGPLIGVVDPLRLLGLQEMAGSIQYLFGQQIEDSDVLAVNKLDLLSKADQQQVKRLLSGHNKPIHLYSARTGSGVAQVLSAALTPQVEPDRVYRSIDYAEYGAAEAELAWLNQRLTVNAGPAVPAADWAMAFLSSVATRCGSEQWDIGHVKVLLREGDRVTKAALVDPKQPASIDVDQLGSFTTAVGMVNARVRCSPTELEELVRSASEQADTDSSAVTNLVEDQRAFAPPQPVPTTRVLVGSNPGQAQPPS